MTKKLYIKTYGCQMNVYDSERMAESLTASGYTSTDKPDDADMILLNTCHIRENASEKIFHELGRLRPLKLEKPDLKIGVTGCVAQAEGPEIMRRMPYVDLVVGPQSYFRLPEMERATRNGEKVVDTDFPSDDKFDHLPQRRKAGHGPCAFLTVQEGCDKFCAFCVVPYTRGSEVSRPVNRILDEARQLVERGVKELTLLGQNVNAYHGQGDSGDMTLSQLIRALAKVDGIDRIRYTTSHPNDMDDDLIAAHGDCEKLMPYLHLPVQSGSDKVLKAMNRKHTVAEYLRTIERVKAARPDILISSDFIVGFPGETDDDFQATVDLINQVGFGQAYSFKYSSRPGTPAANRANVAEEEANQRLKVLQDLIARHQSRVQDQMVGRDVNVLFERKGRDPGQMTGKSDFLHAVHVTADLAPGDIRRVRITHSLTNSLNGVLVE
jgi:tRNA-2-methylthio-N6-dimethylallyladenosine synthase